MNDNPEVQPYRELKGIKMNYRFLIGIGIGAVAGAIMGYIGQCSSGTCPLTSTWWRGALYGAVLGAMFSVNRS